MTKKENKTKEPTKDDIIESAIRNCVEVSIQARKVLDSGSFKMCCLEDVVVLKTMIELVMERYTKKPEEKDAKAAKKA